MNNSKPSFVFYVLSAVLFVAVLFYSFIYGLKNPQSTASMITWAKDFLSAKFLSTTTVPILKFILLFISNSIVNFLMIIGGIIFGIYPIYTIFNNASLTGTVLSFSYHKFGLVVTLANYLPHSLTELTAFFISAGLGLWLGVKFFRKIFFREHEEFRAAFKCAWQKYYKVILPLLLISAIIEAFVTPHIARLFLPQGVNLLK